LGFFSNTEGTYPSGITCDGTYLYGCDRDSDKFYKYNGFSSVVLDSFSTLSTSPVGATWDGTNLYSAGYSEVKIYKHTGFSSAISESINAEGPFITGITWDGTCLYSIDANTDKAYKHNGFSETILDSINVQTTAPVGLTWENFYTRTGGIEIPSMLQSCLVRSYGYNDHDIDCVLTPMESGIKRRRQRTENVPTDFGVMFIFDMSQLSVWDYFNQVILESRVLEFQINLRTGQGFIEHIVKHSQPPEQKRRGNKYEVYCVFEASSRPTQ